MTDPMTGKTLKIALIALAVSGAAAVSAPAMADTYRDRGSWDRGYDRGGYDRGGWDNRRDDRLGDRIAEVRNRIDEGVRRGSLTRNEARRLSDELNRIAYDARRADRSGRGVDRYEYERISERLDRLSERVYFERRDRDVAWRRR